MEVAEGEEAGLEFVGLLIASIDELLIKVGVGSAQIGLEVLWSFVGDLDGALEDGFRDDFHIGKRGWF